MEGMRAGSENLIGLAGLKAAINLIKGQEKALCQKLHDNTLFLKKELKAANIAFEENGEAPKAPGLCNLYFPHIDAETLLIYLDQNGIAVSAGTACASGGVEPSYVLKGMGYSQERILHSIRISLSRFTAPEELSQLITTISKTI